MLPCDGDSMRGLAGREQPDTQSGSAGYSPLRMFDLTTPSQSTKVGVWKHTKPQPHH